MVNLEQPSQSENEEIKIENESVIPTDTIKYKIDKLEARSEKAKSPQARVLYLAQIGALIEERNEIVVKNQGLIRYFVKNTHKDKIEHMHGMTIDDVKQAAQEGLMKGVERFSPSMGYKLSTYVGWWIDHSTSRFIEDNRRTVRTPVYKQEKLRKLIVSMDTFYVKNERLPKNEEIAKIFDITIEKVKELLSLKNGQYLKSLPLDAPMNTSSNASSLMTIFEDKSNWTGEKSGENKTMLLGKFREAAREKLYDIETNRTSIEKANILWHIFSQSFGLNEKGETLTLNALGEIYGVTRERIRQIKTRALKYIKTDAKLIAMLEEIKDVYSFF